MDLVVEAREVRFGGFRLDTVTRRLSAPDGSEVALTGRAYDVLALLIRNRPRVVGKEEILAAVWVGRVVEENNLTQAVSLLRRVFRQHGDGLDPILTVPGRGYGFVAEVDEPQVQEPAPVETAPGTAAPASGWRRRRLPFALAVMFLAVAVVVVVGVFALRPRATPRIASWTAPETATLAVLPFHALDGRQQDDLLQLGMAETVITRLSRATKMRVLSLGSTQAMTDAAIDPGRVGADLHADFLVEGHFQRTDGKIRVTARLLALPAGKVVWAGTFDEEAQRVFEVQDQIASGIAAALSQNYTGLGHLSPCYGSDPAAYRAYLRGRYLLNRPSPRTVGTALASFREAIERDPSCARAWAGVASARRTMVMVSDHDPQKEFPLADAAVERALALDPDSAEAWTSRGFNQFWYHWDWAASEKSLRRAIALDPNSADAHFTLAHLLANIGRFDDAMAEARRAAALDPLSPLLNTVGADFSDEADRQRKVLARFDEVLALEPDFWIALKHRSEVLLEMGDVRGAERDALHSAEAARRNGRSLVYLAMVYRQTGQHERIRQLLEELEARASADFVLPSTLAQLHIALGDPERALDLLEQGYASRDMGLSFLLVWFRSLAGNPRYAALLERMRLPAPVTEAVAAMGTGMGAAGGSGG